MNPVVPLLEKSIRRFVRSKAAIVITFLVPILLIYIFGHVFGLYPKATGSKGGGGGGSYGIPVAVVNESDQPGAAKLIAALKAEKSLRVITEKHAADGRKQAITEEDARRTIRDNAGYHFALIIPADLVRSDAFGVHIRLLTDPRNDFEAQIVNGLVQKVVFTNVPDLLVASLKSRAEAVIGKERLEQFNQSMTDVIVGSFGGNRDDVYRRVSLQDPFRAQGASSSATPTTVDPSLRRLDTTNPAANGSGASLPAADANAEQSTATKDFLAKLVKIEDEQLVGRDVKNPMAARMVGGYAIMFLLFALTGSATSLFEEKQSGIFQRILAAPVRPSHILWSRFLFGIILGAFQLTALFLAGRFLFGLDLESHLGSLAVLTLVSAAACTAFGMLVAAIAPTHEAASGLSTLLVLTMTAIGGAWFPITMMPEFMQKLSRLSLVYWAVEGYSSILWAGHSLRQIAPNLAVLTGISVGVMLLAGYLFKRSKIFE